MGDSSIFFAKFPPLQQLCHVILKISDATFDFHLQILRCRQLLSACSHIVASPQISDKTLIDAVVHVEFYKKKFGFFCHKLNLKPLQASIANNMVVECCIMYTVKFRLSPGWNQIGSVLAANADFLACYGKIEAVTLDISVRNEEMTIKLKPHLMRLPPPKLENFGICPQALNNFYEDADYDIPESAINLQWCHILPSMKRGQLVRISHKMPCNGSDNSLLKDYDGLRKYWKIQYGYCLPESADDMVFCSVYFMQLSSNLFTYPLMCLRNRSIQYMPRCDGPAITKKFFCDIRQKFNSICGLPLTYSGKACLALNHLSIASKVKPDVPQNVRMSDRYPQSSTSSSDRLQQVPSNDIILSTQISCNKDVTCQKSASMSKSLMEIFPTTSDGKYIPVFGSKNRVFPSKTNAGGLVPAISKGLTQSKVAIASSSSAFKKPSTSQKSFANLMNKGLSEKQTFNPLLKSKKHNFDQIFSSASSNIQKGLIEKQTVQPLPKSKKHKFDQLFSSASSNGQKELLEKQTVQPLPKSKKHKFDQLFSSASSNGQKGLLEKQTVQPPPKSKKHKFDQLFSSASSNGQKGLLEKQTVHPPPKSKKHKFDQLFSSASSSVQKAKLFKNPRLNVKTCPK